MVSDDLGQRLHDRATRGRTLTAEERGQLEAWYAQQDTAENDALHLLEADTDIPTLEAQVQAALEQLAVLTSRIQQVTAENNSLRREISSLRQQLAIQKQPA
jgi:cell division protein FtsB